MAYTKTVWKDQDVENPRTYIARDNGDDTITLLDAFGTVTELGTPVNATNMNKIENGIYEHTNTRGKTKQFRVYLSFNDYLKSGYYEDFRMEKVMGFYIVVI